MNNVLKSTKGITLIALVITIILLRNKNIWKDLIDLANGGINGGLSGGLINQWHFK